MYCFENGKLRDLDMNFDDLVDELKGRIIMHLMQKHSLTWLNDESAGELRCVLFEFLEPFFGASGASGDGRPE